MSGIVKSLLPIAGAIGGSLLLPGVGTAAGAALGGAAGVGAADLIHTGGKVPPPPTAPSQDTAANAALAQQNALMRRRGLLANIAGGALPGAATAPTTQTKSALGN
jgi:hypothetical protein